MTLPVDLPAARRQIQLDENDETQDALLTDCIADAAAWVETYTGHILQARQVTETFTGFGQLRLRAWPVTPDAAVTVAYGADLTVADARLAPSRVRPARLWPAVGARWPSVAGDTAISVEVRAGYEAPGDVPRNLRRAMLVLIGGYHADREGGETFKAAEASARSLCRDFRARGL